MRLRSLLGALGAALSFCAAHLAVAAVPLNDQAIAVEFYHAQLDHYFISADAGEISDLDTGKHPGWTRTGYRFAVIKPGSTYPGTVPMCRFYSPRLDTHFYSANAQECADVKVKFPDTWQLESDAVFRAFPVDPNTGACPAGTSATYRLYNKRADANHRYTNQISAFVYMVAKGYQPEGDGDPTLPVVFCTPEGSDAVPAPSASAPSCTVTASTQTPALGSTLALGSACTNNPTTFLWTNCVSTNAKCSVSRSSAGIVPYTLYSANDKGPGAPETINVTWGGTTQPPPTNPNDPPPVCNLYATEMNPIIGTQIRLTASCTGNPTSIVWGGTSACGNGVYCQAYSATPGEITYSVYGVNAAGAGSAATVTVNWKDNVTPTVPVCSLSSSNSSPSVGTSITLSAFCTNSPTAFKWVGCTSTGSTCSDSAATIGTKTYSVVATNASGDSEPASITVDWAAVPVQPPVCQISASSIAPTVGQSITLTATCTGSPTAFEWTGGCTAPSTSSTCTATSATSAPVTYYVVGSNQYGASNAAGITVSWQPTSGGGNPGGGNTGLCAQYKDVTRFTLAWGDNKRKPTDDLTSFGPDSVIVMELTVPAGQTPLRYAGYTSIYEYMGAPAIRIMNISKSACDFRNDDPTGANGPFTTSGGVLASIPWNVGPGGAVQLQPGETYYFNFKNYNCTGTCNAAIETIFPHD